MLYIACASSTAQSKVFPKTLDSTIQHINLNSSRRGNIPLAWKDSQASQRKRLIDKQHWMIQC